jgi:hypothetical protein
MLPKLPVGIRIFLVGVAIPFPVQPRNLYPSLVGAFNIIFSLSIVYDEGFGVSKIPPPRL